MDSPFKSPFQNSIVEYSLPTFHPPAQSPYSRLKVEQLINFLMSSAPPQTSHTSTIASLKREVTITSRVSGRLPTHDLLTLNPDGFQKNAAAVRLANLIAREEKDFRLARQKAEFPECPT
jgi:hypothetical protein